MSHWSPSKGGENQLMMGFPWFFILLYLLIRHIYIHMYVE